MHFSILLWQPASDYLVKLVNASSDGTLMLCGICFLLSFPVTGGWHPRRVVAAGLSVPSLALCACIVFQVHPSSISLGLILLLQALGLIFLWKYNKDRLTITIPGTVLISVCCQWSSFEIFSRHSDKAISIVLMELFAAYALLFAHDFPRWSAGVGTTVAGLLGWAAVFPVSMLFDTRWPSLEVNPEIWDVPKVVVAFGMLVTLFENELTFAQQEREQYRSLFDSNPLPMWIFDKESTQLLEGNSAAVRDFGWDRGDFAGLTINDLDSDKETSPVGLVELNWRLAKDVTAGSRPSANETTNEDEVRSNFMHFQTKNGEDVAVEVALRRVEFHGREARLLVAKDITAQVEAQEQLIHLANHDPLTGLPNRLLLHDRMKSAFATAMRRSTKAAILCIDLDRFKQINDTFGHAAGDNCLREIANRFRHRLRSVDTAARTGGEEFMIILDDVGNLHDAERVANDLLFSVSAPHVAEGSKIYMSASIGIALFPDDGEEPAELWSMADAAMYRAKQSGGNCHMFFSRTNQ